VIRRLAALAAALLATGSAQPGAPTVPVSGGLVAGSRSDDGQVLLYRGIPFAAAPVGSLRWRPPQPVAAWRGVRADRPDAPACPQNDYGWNRADHLRGAEDCLTLDIATPSLAGKRPVLVWIHGGSNRAGSAHGTVLSPIARRGVVMVAIQYRLGILGFLAPRGAAAETRGAAGNYGLMDQVAALRWVRANIARFGGDPANVTIAGESAGSQDASLMLATPAAQGLFARAILESGTPGFGMPPRPLRDALLLGDQAERLLGGAGIVAMRRQSVGALLAADRKLTDPTLRTNDYLWLRATTDGAVLPTSPRALLASAPPRPVIVGTNRAEFGPEPSQLDWTRALAATFGKQAAEARAFYRIDDPHRHDDPRLGHAELEYETDRVFRCPAGRLAQLLSARGAPVWRYEFDIGPNGGRTSHGAEIGYALGDSRIASGLSLQPYWLNFIRSGDPNGEGLPAWPRFTPASQRHILFDASGAKPGARLRAQPCDMLDAL
jgi:para-nitrobenzyl esterase